MGTPKSGTRRVTLILPVKALSAAERIARARKVNLSAVVSEALEKTLHAEAEAKREGERRVKAWEALRQSHSDLTDEQWMLLDGIILSEPVDEES
jgi:post-segregation antitoxin (ccd killing protein)